MSCLGCLMSRQHVTRGHTCLTNLMVCYTETEAAGKTYLETSLSYNLTVALNGSHEPLVAERCSHGQTKSKTRVEQQ